jgi:Nucleotidyl transferase
VFCEEAPLGTAGALLSARHALDDDFPMMNGDALFDVNLRALEVSARASGMPATIALRAVDDVSRYGSVEEQDGRVVSFSEKNPNRRGPGKINGGIYVLKKKIALARTCHARWRPMSLRGSSRAAKSMAGFPKVTSSTSVFRKRSNGDGGNCRWCEPGRPPFLDRDGAINFDSGYLKGKNDIPVFASRFEEATTLARHSPLGL